MRLALPMHEGEARFLRKKGPNFALTMRESIDSSGNDRFPEVGRVVLRKPLQFALGDVSSGKHGVTEG